MLSIIMKLKRTLIQKLLYPVVMAWVKRNLMTKDELLIQTEKENNLYRFGSEEVIPFEKPTNLPKDIHKWSIKVSETKNLYTTTISTPYVSVVKDLELIGPDAIGVTKNGKVIFETVGSRMNCLQLSISNTLNNFGIQDIQFMREPPLIDLAFSLVFTYRGYFHWLLDSLVRIQGFEHFCKKTGEKPVIIIPPEPPSWMLQSLELVGYDLGDCIQWNGKRTTVNRLVLPSFSRYQPNPMTSPAACHWLCDRILSNITSCSSQASNNISFSPNIFISRKKAGRRRIVNEDELIEKLSRLGFVAYTLEDMSVAEQVRLFSQAEIVVAPHGAGLTNMIFSEKVAVIELFGSRIPLFYFTLAEGLGFQYDFLKCQPQGEDMRVNYNEFSELIKRFI